MFDYITKITEKPGIYCCYTAEALWNDPYISGQMLKNHLNPSVDLASRRFDFIDESVTFIKERFKLGAGKAVIDFGCGPGLYTTRLARLGCTVRGGDFSSNSIDYAQTEAARLGLDIEYFHLNYLEYQPNKQYDLLIMIFCDYCVLSMASTSTPNMAAISASSRMLRLLAPDFLQSSVRGIKRCGTGDARKD